MPCLDITIGEVKKSDESHHFVYPSGTRPRRTRAENTASPEFIRLGRVAKGFAVNYYSFTLGRLGSTALSTFAIPPLAELQKSITQILGKKTIYG